MANEKRLIDANKLEARMGGLCDEFGTDHLFIDAIVYEIGNAPDVDAVEVVHGEWLWTEEDNDDVQKYWVCSKCSDYVYFKTNYCPNCGAKMDGDGNA